MEPVKSSRRASEMTPEPQETAEEWLATAHEPDSSAIGVRYERSDMIDAHPAGWDHARALTAAERDRLLALVDKATRDHADVGLPGEVRRANANRAEAGLELLPVPGEDASGEPAPVGEGGVLFPAGCDPDAADDDFTQDRHADLDPNAGEADPQVWGSE